MAFKDIKGQERAVEFLRNSVNRERLSHAYLFCGPEGLGKTMLAKNLAKFLNCEDPLKEGALFIDCCDSCLSCRKINDFNHPDVHWLTRGGNARNISIDEIRLLQKEISLKAYEGRFKFFIIQDAHQMSEQAANCLLKTLEEPPVFSVIILIAVNIRGLLPTIISRCQLVKFYPLPYERLKDILSVNYGMNSDDVRFLSAASEGRIGQALRLKDQDTFKEKNRLIEEVCLLNPGGVKRQASFNAFNIKDKKKLATQIRYLLNWFRDILIFKIRLPEYFIINADRMEAIKSRAAFYTFEDLEQIIAKIDQAHRLIEQNVNRKLALEVMLGEIARCRK